MVNGSTIGKSPSTSSAAAQTRVVSVRTRRMPQMPIQRLVTGPATA